MSNEKIKQVIVIRKDLKMRRGKEIAQGAHASMMFIRNILLEIKEKENKNYFGFPSSIEDFFRLDEWEWISGGRFAKITVVVNSEEELLAIEKSAKEAGLVVHTVVDAGMTEFHGVPTKTCLAIGPDQSEKIDRITGHLKLY